MAVIRLTKEFSFEAAHALDGYDGPCREIHGHSYRLFVTVAGRPVADPENPKYGMVMDFGVLKRIVNEQIVSRFDHAFVLRDSERGRAVREALGERFSNIVVVDYQPRARTCSPTSPAALPPACRRESGSIRCGSTRRPRRSPSGSPRTTPHDTFHAPVKEATHTAPL